MSSAFSFTEQMSFMSFMVASPPVTLSVGVGVFRKFDGALRWTHRSISVWRRTAIRLETDADHPRSSKIGAAGGTRGTADILDRRRFCCPIQGRYTSSYLSTTWIAPDCPRTLDLRYRADSKLSSRRARSVCWSARRIRGDVIFCQRPGCRGNVSLRAMLRKWKRCG